MRPIEQRVDLELLQALRCVEYRIPKPSPSTEMGFLMSLSLRYGLVTAAAASHLLSVCQPNEQDCVLDSMQQWPDLIASHIRTMAGIRLPMRCHDFASTIANWAMRALQTSLPVCGRLCPLEMCPEMAADDFLVANSRDIQHGHGILQRRRALRAFQEEAKRSVAFAINFYERRQFGLEEVPEIALLGE